MLVGVATNSGAGFWLGIVSALMTAAILGTLAFSKRWFKREIIDPIQELKADFKKEKSKRRRFQRKIVRRVDAYEARAAEERRAQIIERHRVSASD